MQLRAGVDEEDGALATTYYRSRVLSVAGIFFFFPAVDFISPNRSSIVAYWIARVRAAARMWCALAAQFPQHLRRVLPRRVHYTPARPVLLTLATPQRRDRRCCVSLSPTTSAVAVSGDPTATRGPINRRLRPLNDRLQSSE